MRGGLASRLLLASGLLALVVGAAFAVLVSAVADLHGSQHQARQSEEILIEANQLERLIIDMETGQRGFLLTGQGDLLQPWQAAQNGFAGQAAKLKRLVESNPQQLQRADRIVQASTSYLRDYSVPLVEAAQRDRKSVPIVPVTEEGKRRIDAIRAEFDRLINAEQDIVGSRQRDSDATARRAMLAATAGLAGSVILIALYAVYLTRAIVQPVRRAAAMADRLAGGDLTARLPQGGVGAVGVLQRCFNSMAQSLQDSRNELAASRARIIAAADQARRHIERDLHDGTQQRMVSALLDLRAAEASVPAGQRELRAQLGGIADGLAETVDELREISRGIHPAILSEGGLAPALKALARRSTIPVELDIDVPQRLPESIEVGAYYAASEALTNTAKHAEASFAQIDLRVRAEHLQLSVRDDGIGGADARRGSGLMGLTDRVHALGGSVSVSSPPGEGTTLVIDLPLTAGQSPAEEMPGSGTASR
jgi:signal transduction histidine kinase